MRVSRSGQYSKLCMNIFLLSVSQIEEELRRLAWFTPNPLAIFVGDVTYAEYEFLLLTERDFKVNCMGKPTGFTDEVEAFLADA